MHVRNQIRIYIKKYLSINNPYYMQTNLVSDWNLPPQAPFSVSGLTIAASVHKKNRLMFYLLEQTGSKLTLPLSEGFQSHVGGCKHAARSRTPAVPLMLWRWTGSFASVPPGAQAETEVHNQSVIYLYFVVLFFLLCTSCPGEWTVTAEEKRRSVEWMRWHVKGCLMISDCKCSSLRYPAWIHL